MMHCAVKPLGGNSGCRYPGNRRQRLIRLTAFLFVLLAGSGPVLAETTAPYDPASSAPPVAYPGFDRLPEAGTTMGEDDWRSANDTVGAFSRGHIDILRWEAANLPRQSEPDDVAREPLSVTEALRIALSRRPELFVGPDMGALERARADIAFVEFARDVQRTWIHAVAAAEDQRAAALEHEAVAVGAELAERMTRVGNWGQDRLLREQRALSDANLRLAQARQAAVSSREALVRTMGLWGDAAASFSLPDRLPDLPEVPLESDGLEAAALQSHPGMSLAAIDAERAKRGLASRTRDMWNEARDDALSGVFDPLADGNPLEQRIATAPRLDRRLLPPGHEAESAAKAEAKAVGLAVRIRSQVREAYHQYRIAHDLARNAAEAERLSEALQEEMLLRYNGMLNSTWDLLAASRDRAGRSGAAVQAQRDFWLAHANLHAVLAGAGYEGPDSISVGGGRAQNGGGH